MKCAQLCKYNTTGCFTSLTLTLRLLYGNYTQKSLEQAGLFLWDSNMV